METLPKDSHPLADHLTKSCQGDRQASGITEGLKGEIPSIFDDSGASRHDAPACPLFGWWSCSMAVCCRGGWNQRCDLKSFLVLLGIYKQGIAYHNVSLSFILLQLY